MESSGRWRWSVVGGGGGVWSLGRSTSPAAPATDYSLQTGSSPEWLQAPQPNITGVFQLNLQLNSDSGDLASFNMNGEWAVLGKAELHEHFVEFTVCGFLDLVCSPL